MCIYRDYLRPILFKLDPEHSHNLAHIVIADFLPMLGIFARRFIYAKSDLQVPIFGKTVSNPIGLAAGFDKNGDLVHSLNHLGFGYAEVGSITAQVHEGNPSPRLWRLPADGGLINWLGLNSKGAVKVAEGLANANFSLPVSANIAKSNKPEITGKAVAEDMLTSFRTIRHLPLFYVSLNVSCPNTSEGVMEETKALATLLEQISKENPANLPILLKLSPDSADSLINEICELGKRFHVAGYICGNTSTSRDGLKTENAQSLIVGGLSGSPLKPLALSLCRKVFALKEASQIIIGCGGISTGQDAYDFIKVGASLLQLYTALIYEGPSTVRKICEELSVLLKRDGLTLSQAVGMECAH